MNVRALDQQAYCLTGKWFVSANFLFNSMMSHTKSKFADPAINFSQILPIRWFCEVFYKKNIDTKNDVRMYRCFPVIDTLLWLWLILLTSILYLCPFIHRCPGEEGKGWGPRKLSCYRQLFVCGKMQGSVIVPTSLKGKISRVQLSCYLFFFLNLLVFYQKPSLEKLQLF